MALRPERLLHQLQRLTCRHDPDPDSDADLLGRFVRDRDEAAFSALVDRHFGLVRGVCRRVLGDVHAAEDAAQATFLLLARKASSLRRPETLSAWLHGVARRLALRCRRADVRRRQREQQAIGALVRPSRDPLEELTARELLVLLDEEVQRLPETYRLPIILCCLEGHDQAEAARLLGWTPGSVKGRLERGRARLHARLARRGVALPTVLLTLEAARGAAPAGLSRAATAFAAGRPSDGGISTAVVALAQGGVTVMFLTRLKVALVLVAVFGLVGTGAGWLANTPGKGEPAAVAVSKDRRGRDRRADALAAARADLRRAAEEAEKADVDLTNLLIKVRQGLVELEEQLRQTEEESLPQLSAKQTRLHRETEQLVVALTQLERTLKNADREPQVIALKRRLDDVQKRRLVLGNQEATWQAERGKRRLELRRQMVSQEENIRELERKRDAHRDQAERRRETIAERIRRLEGDPLPRESDRSQRGLERKLDAIQRDLAELRRDVQRLRTGKRK